jgi:hypothetical protein
MDPGRSLAFDARWPFGTRERLAKELLLATAQRRSDALKVGPANRQGDELVLYHSKNDSGTMVPMGPDLLEALRTFPGARQPIWKRSSESPSPRPASTTGSSAPASRRASGTARPTACARQRAAVWPRLARPFSKAAR